MSFQVLLFIHSLDFTYHYFLPMLRKFSVYIEESQVCMQVLYDPRSLSSRLLIVVYVTKIVLSKAVLSLQYFTWKESHCTNMYLTACNKRTWSSGMQCGHITQSAWVELVVCQLMSFENCNYQGCFLSTMISIHHSWSWQIWCGFLMICATWLWMMYYHVPHVVMYLLKVDREVVFWLWVWLLSVPKAKFCLST